MTPRRIAALRRMAAQSVSPNEREIAKAKLINAEDEDDDWRAAWADQQEHERLLAEQQRAAREAEYADIVRRWEAGTFLGLTARLGASGAESRFQSRATPPKGRS